MATVMSYKCEKCGFNGYFSIIAINTFVTDAFVQCYCKTCNDVVSVPIGYDMNVDISKQKLNCPTCNSSVVTWIPKQGCPKCGGKMVKGSEGILAD